MAATLIRVNPVFQAYGQLAAWNVVAGDRERDSVLLESVAAHSDNNLNQSTDLLLRLTPNEPPIGGGGLIRITGVRVT